MIIVNIFYVNYYYNNWLVDFAVTADHWVKSKENEEKDKYLDIAWELKKSME